MAEVEQFGIRLSVTLYPNDSKRAPTSEPRKAITDYINLIYQCINQFAKTVIAQLGVILSTWREPLLHS